MRVRKTYKIFFCIMPDFILFRYDNCSLVN